MNFKTLLSFETLAAVLGSALVAFLVDVAKVRPYWLLLVVPLSGLAIGYNVTRRRLAVFHSGLVAYKDTFGVRDGHPYWTSAKEELAYWGVTGASIIEDLKLFFHEEQGQSTRYSFLLMSTTGHAIRDQVAFKRRFPHTGRTPEQEKSIESEVSVEDQRLRATLAVLRATAAFNTSPSRMEIRLYDEFLPWWMYMLDGKQVVVGILRAGQEVGDQPAAILTRNAAEVTLFESFHENFERVWRSARSA